jgi:group I intron endonuclease
MFLIYKITCTVTNKAYIGFTKRTPYKRWLSHLAALKRGVDTHLYRAIKKYGESTFTREVVFCTTTEEYAKEYEQYFIKEYNTLASGYNMTIGGDGGTTTNRKISLEHKNKISKKLKNRIFTVEHKQKISDALMGHKHSPETLKKLQKPKSEEHKEKLKGTRENIVGENNPFYGKTHTAETRKKIANRSYEKSSKRVEVNGVVYNSVKQATKELGLAVNAITDILNGKGAKKYAHLEIKLL